MSPVTLATVACHRTTCHDHRLMATLTINHEGLARLRKDAKAPVTNNGLARLLGVDKATVSRVLSGRAVPGPRFIVGSLRAFGTVLFSDVFLVTET